MNTITWRQMRRYPVRFALAATAVALGVAFVCGTFMLRTMLNETYGAMSDSMVAADGYVRATKAPDETRGLVPAGLVDEIRTVDGVADAAPVVAGPMALLGADGEPVGVRTGGSQRPGDQGTPAPSYAVVAGAEDPTVSLVSGRLPRGDGEIVLDEATATAAGYSVEDTARIILGGETRSVHVVGVVNFEAYPSGTTLVGVDEATGMASFAADGLVSAITVTASDGVAVPDLVERVAGAVKASALIDAGGVEVVDQEVLRAENTAELDTSMGVYAQALTGLAVISLLIAMFLIANTFSMTVRQQLRETAVLRALGAQPRQVLTSVLVQAAVVGVAGSVVGVGAGFALVLGLRGALGAMGMDLEGAIPVEGSTIVLGLVLGILISLISVFVPAYRSARTPPIIAMQEQDTATGGMRVRTVIGLLVLVVGIVATVVAVRGGNQSVFGVGVIALPVGALLLAPVVLPPVIRFLSWPATRFTSAVGPLAGRNAARNPRRSAATVTALMIGMILVGIVSVFAASTDATMRTALGNEVDSDFIVQSAQGPVPDALVTTLEQTPGAQVDTLQFANLRAEGHPVTVGSLTTGAEKRSLLLPVVAGDMATLADGQVAVQETAAKEYGWALGETIELTNPETETSASASASSVVIGAILDSGALGSQVLVGPDLYRELVPQQGRATGTVFASTDGDVEELRGQLTAAAAAYPVVTVLDKEAYLASVLEFVAQLQVVLYAVLGLALIVALLGIVNLLALSVAERTREIGMLRAVGMSEKEIAAMVLIESALLTVFGAIVGLAVGVGVSSPMAAVFKSMGISVLSIPWGQLAAMVVIAALAGTLAALWPARRAARLPVLQAVSQG